jgi:two-component system osmolarity sensor histidine kinase EnvZ
MVLNALKKLMPRSLYGRAALILFLPIVVLQLVVVVGFSQRYFSDVTRQLMAGVQVEIELYTNSANTLPAKDVAATFADLDTRLGFSSTLESGMPAEKSHKSWFDFSGKIITDILFEQIEGIEGVDLMRNQRAVFVSLQTKAGHVHIEFPRARASARNPHQVILITVFTGMIMSYIAASFLRNQLRPIRRLARASEAFGRGNNIPFRISGASEVRAAGMAFLAMRSRIERHIEQRTLILSGVSHDLRTPLTRMKLSLSLLDADDTQAAEITEMQADVREMERLLDEFLAFTRSDALEEPEKVDPVTLLQDAQARASRGGASVTFDVPAHAPTQITVRPISIARALDNLISNALRYGNAAHLSLTVHERSIVFSIEDNGPGIAQEDREKVLQPFVRLDESRNQNKETGAGVGLGLAIATDIARKHGGSLRLGQSERLGGLKVDIVLAYSL